MLGSLDTSTADSSDKASHFQSGDGAKDSTGCYSSRRDNLVEISRGIIDRLQDMLLLFIQLQLCGVPDDPIA